MSDVRNELRQAREGLSQVRTQVALRTQQVEQAQAQIAASLEEASQVAGTVITTFHALDVFVAELEGQLAEAVTELTAGVEAVRAQIPTS